MDNRGVSEVLGVVLVTLVVVALAVFIAPTVLGQFETADRTVHVDVRASASHVVIDNYGGEALEVSSVTVIIRTADRREEVALGAGTLEGGDDPATWEQGERWTSPDFSTLSLSVDEGDRIEVFIRHESGAVVAQWDGHVRE